MGKRFAIVIGVAAAGVIALGAQTAVAGGEPVDNTPPDLQLSGKKKQNLGTAGRRGVICNRGSCANAVKVKASCGDEACTLNAEGKLTKVKQDKLKPASAHLDPGEGQLSMGRLTTTLKLTMTEKTRKKARKALEDGKNVQAKVTVKATDAAGNVATAKRTVKLVK